MDAVCFTSGPKGAAFSAGAIHAWLAADREPPLVVAGISTGALTSAAMNKCYRELESASADTLERDRWTWYRRYLDAITRDPLSFFWKAMPDPVDFFADKPPVRDLSIPGSLGEVEQPAARRHYHLLTKLGIWFAGLPVRVQTIASIAVHFVRLKEKYGSALVSGYLLAWNGVKAVAGVWWHLLRAPSFFRESEFNRGGSRPLFGWLIWLGSMAPSVLFAVVLYVTWIQMKWPIWWSLVAAVFIPVGVLGAITATYFQSDRRWDLPKFLFQRLDLSKGFISQFELRRRLFDLFRDDALEPKLAGGHKEMHVLLVCAALQQRKQVWPGSDARLVDALSAAMAVPGIFPPVCNDELHWRNYTKDVPAEAIDGKAIRSNPIPAFFEWCRTHPAVAEKLERPGRAASLHVVYNVPIEPEAPLNEAPAKESIDIVESAQISLELEKRRDTRQEVKQTYFISSLEAIRRRTTGTARREKGAFTIFPDEIAPRQEISYTNEMDPTRAETLKVVAQGCRRTLETLYRDRLAGDTACAKFLPTVAGRRMQHMHGAPGLPEVCAACTGVLSHRPRPAGDAAPPGVIRSYGEPGDGSGLKLKQLFPHLSDTPRIVFLGSGGVFRGAFHIGVVGAMKAVRLFPDLVLGASVGTLMGGALATIAVAPVPQEDQILEALAEVFLRVSERVALTRTLKNAAKQLGVRARNIKISPAELRRMVLKGSQADPGFAATGAPPALIDAISTLFMIPHRQTAEIASDFVAGHITDAINRFLGQVRTETLTSFDIQYELMGVSLLEREARKLLGETVDQVHTERVQPYHDPAPGKSKVSFFCTTSFLNARQSLVLGRDFLTFDPTWDSIVEGLSSSAFPAVFSPCSEARLLPGKGRTDRWFADGGILDNLPFFPAIEILGAVQAAEADKDPAAVLSRLETRTRKRDVFIAAGLDALPETSSSYDTLFKIHSRAKSLSVTSKVDTFLSGCKSTQKALEDIVRNSKGVGEEDARFLDGVVSAAILRIYPSDKDHINPTFAFCSTTGMDPERISRSIADGCFQSLVQFQHAYRQDETTRAAFDRNSCRVHELKIRTNQTKRIAAPADCPYFMLGDEPLACPFAQTGSGQVKQIRNVCARDEVHRKLVQK